jgi:hypothetical protein
MASLQIRRGSDAERQNTVFLIGEPVWTNDTHKLYIGDGSTHGGIPVNFDEYTDVTVSNKLRVGTETSYLEVQKTFIVGVHNGTQQMLFGPNVGFQMNDDGATFSVAGGGTFGGNLGALSVGASLIEVTGGASIYNGTATFVSTNLGGVVNSSNHYADITGTNVVYIDQFDGLQYTSAKYTVQIKDSGAIHFAEVTLFYDSAENDVYINTYGVLTNQGELGTISASVSNHQISLNFTPTDATSMKIRVAKTLMAV